MQEMQLLLPEIDTSGGIALYNSETKDGVKFSKDDIITLSTDLSPIYIELIDHSSQIIANQFSIPILAAKVTCRRSFVPILHIFFERLKRLKVAISSHSSNIGVATATGFITPNIPEDLEQSCMSLAFNESMICFLADIWNLPKISKSKKIKDTDFAKLPTFNNFLFKFGKKKSIVNRIFRKLETIEKAFPGKNKIPVLSFANADGAFRSHGFFLTRFRQVEVNWKYSIKDVDIDLREKIFSLNFFESEKISRLLSSIGLTTEQSLIAKTLLTEFIRKNYPVQFLEGLVDNYNFAQVAIKPYKVKAILSSSVTDTKSIFITAAAKANGFRIIDLQHGGHYGYFRDISPSMEMELPLMDDFLSWGWTKMHEMPALSNIQVTPLPSPWLSERKKYWKSYTIGGKKDYDILWMPQMMKRFTGAPQGASSIRRDVIQEFGKEMIGFLSLAVKAKIKVYCKPYNALTVELMSKTYETLSEIGGEYFVCSDRFDKGLHIDLIEKVKLILWDQPGTGFLECISSGIPTMAYWSRLYCEEEDWTKDDFMELERCGIMHRNPEALITEYQNFAKSPLDWMSDLKRKEVVKRFSDKFALTHDKWWKVWHKYLDRLTVEVNHD